MSWLTPFRRWCTNRLTTAQRFQNDHLRAAVRANKVRTCRFIRNLGNLYLGGCDNRCHVQEFTRKRKPLLAPVVGDQTKVANAVEATGQNVQQEAAHELIGTKRHG